MEIKRNTHCRKGHEYTEANTYNWLGQRYCKECRKIYSRDNVPSIRASQHKSFLKYKETRYAQNKIWVGNNKERYRITKIARRYRIPVSVYIAMCKEQNGICFICKKQAKLGVDHNHSSGRVRKLLCAQCNAGLGLFFENPDLLRAAADYCEVHNVDSEGSDSLVSGVQGEFGYNEVGIGNP